MQKARLTKLPPWVEDLPEESRHVFKLCLGQVFPVAEIDANGLLVLDVSAIDPKIGGRFNDIRVEPEFVTVEPPR